MEGCAGAYAKALSVMMHAAACSPPTPGRAARWGAFGLGASCPTMLGSEECWAEEPLHARRRKRQPLLNHAGAKSEPLPAWGGNGRGRAQPLARVLAHVHVRGCTPQPRTLSWWQAMGRPLDHCMLPSSAPAPSNGPKPRGAGGGRRGAEQQGWQGCGGCAGTGAWACRDGTGVGSGGVGWVPSAPPPPEPHLSRTAAGFAPTPCGRGC